jgi:hypothetical protein
MIYVIIPNYNGIQHLKVCFESLRNQTHRDYVAIMVDNGSSDGSLEFVKDNYPEVVLVSLDKNYGFAFATNEGTRYAMKSDNCDYVLFLNNDIECDKEFLENIISGFNDNNIGSTTSKILNYYERDMFDTAGDYYDLFSYPYRRGGDEKDTGQYNVRGFVFGGCGGATAYRTDVLKKIGLLDESFFAYYEDIDLNYRMQLAGYKCLYIPEAVCYHKCGATIKRTFGKKFYLMERNLISLQVKNFQFGFFLKYGIASVFIKYWNYLRFIKRLEFNLFFYSLAGFFAGIFNSYKYFDKRSDVKKLIVSSSDYIENISMDFKRGYKEFYKYSNNF